MTKATGEYLFVMGDGDKIRERIEYYLLNGEIENLKRFSQNLTDGVNRMKLFAASTMSAEIIMAGGDDILIRVESKRYNKAFVEQLAESFRSTTGVNCSFGIGRTVESVYLNLRRAKASGSGNIIDDEVE